MYPMIEFVANTGGLLGLCTGFSFVTFFEIIYQVIREIFWCARERAKKTNYQETLKTHSKELLADDPPDYYSSPVPVGISVQSCPRLARPEKNTFLYC